MSNPKITEHDDDIERMIRHGDTNRVIREALGCSMHTISLCVRTRGLHGLRGVNQGQRSDLEPVDEPEGTEEAETVTITLREYELLCLVADLAHDNTRLRNVAQA